jgi:hypothetical protein
MQGIDHVFSVIKNLENPVKYNYTPVNLKSVTNVKEEYSEIYLDCYKGNISNYNTLEQER